MSGIFISYSSKSKNLVSTLVDDLETADHQIWFDHKLTGGQEWWDQILEKIRQCDLFIFALTPEALNSYPCQLEYKYAYQLHKNILPVWVADDVPVNLLPPELSVIQFVDYRSQDRQAALRLMSALIKLPPPQPMPDPLPEPPVVPISYLGTLKEQIETPRNLSFDEQTGIVAKLREYLREGDNPDDAITLLRQMKKRPDLFATVDKEIDALLTSNMPRQPKTRQGLLDKIDTGIDSVASKTPSLSGIFSAVAPKAGKSNQIPTAEPAHSMDTGKTTVTDDHKGSLRNNRFIRALAVGFLVFAIFWFGIFRNETSDRDFYFGFSLAVGAAIFLITLAILKGWIRRKQNG